MRLTSESCAQLRWLLLAALSTGACGGNVSSPAGASGGSAGSGEAGAGGAPVGGSGGSAGNAGQPTAGSAGSPPHGECDAPTSNNSGFVTCVDGTVHREAKTQCKNTLPTTPVTCGTAPDTYECDGSKREHCNTDASFGAPPPTTCSVGCVEDADCGAGEICECGTSIGHCTSASCTVDRDCGEGYLCRRITIENGIGCGPRFSFQCQLPADSCHSAQDCPSDPMSNGQRCQPAMPGGPLRCEPVAGVACGRPFLVESAPRLARAVSNSDWPSSCPIGAADFDQAERASLAMRYTQLGLMEHASIAAFARFTLQLLSLGAPHELVLESNQAIMDETHHAELCFGLASSFAASAMGPGKLDTSCALEHSSLRDVALNTFLEGCIGETVAALEAAEGLSLTTLPSVRNVLSRVAEDEAKHASLAWRFVAWAITQAPELTALLSHELVSDLERAAATVTAFEAREVPAGTEPHWARAGLLDDGTRAALRVRALREVVAPCLAALGAAPAVPETRPDSALLRARHV